MNVAAAFPADVATLPLTRRFVASVLADVTVRDETLDAAVLVTSELASNAMCHARDTDVVVRLSCTPEQLRIEVADHDAAMAAPDETADRPPWSGLRLVEAHCSAWGVEQLPAGKQVWAVLPLP